MKQTREKKRDAMLDADDMVARFAQAIAKLGDTSFRVTEEDIKRLEKRMKEAIGEDDV